MEMTQHGLPAHAAVVLYPQRALSVLSYIVASVPLPRRMADEERHMLGSILRLPRCAAAILSSHVRVGVAGLGLGWGRCGR